MKKIFAICGSIKTDSANHKLLSAIQQQSNGLFDIELFSGLSELPYFNPDPEKENAFELVNTFRKKIAEADGVIICTPEYVFSLPGILKNALEWTVSTMVFTDKPAALITASSSGRVAHESLQLVMKTLGVATTPDTTLLISGIKSKMDTTGNIHDPTTNILLENLIRGFSALIQQTKK